MSNQTDGKASLDEVYDRPDPRGYFDALEGRGYQIPQHGADTALELLDSGDRDGVVLDVCCSYGILGMLLKTTLQIHELADHYQEHSRLGTPVEDLVDADRRLMQQYARPGAPQVVGLDIAASAVGYGLSTGALDRGLVADLEEEPGEKALPPLDDVDLVLTTGGIGYVTHRTYGRLAGAVPDETPFASYCLRTYDFEPIRRTLDAHGRATRSVTEPVRQRQFMDDAEGEWAMEQALALGHDPEPYEATGWYYAQLHLSTPERVPV